MSRTQVLINGAGPTGLVLALWLTKQGIAVRITDRIEATPSTSRAVVVHARTIELYRQLGLAQDVVADGEKAQATNMWTNGVFRVRVPLGDAGKGITPFPFFHIYPQYRHERFLERKLNEMGVYVERNKEMVDFTDHGDRVTARLKDPRKETSDPEILETIEAAYIAGCDGAHSAVRRACNIHFTGATYSQLFFVADIQAHGAMANGEPNITFNGSNIFLILPYQEAGHVRLNGAIHSENLSKPMSEITFEDVAHSTIGNMPITVDKVNWFSTYHVHHRVADSFRQGRAFLVGDAGHIHSPVGGQGMNTGTGDAINLAWKLAAVLRGRAAPAILDTYEQERRAFAQVLVETTDYAFNMLAKQSYLASFVRYWVIPYVLPWLVWINVFRHNAFKRVSQMALNYRQSALSAGVAGRVQGGDRLPWAVVGEKDNSDSLSEIEWQTHVYGNVQDGLKEWCGRNQVALHVFSWDEEYASVGLARDAAYLIRPDTYVAVAEPSGLPDSFEKFFRDTGIHLK